MRRGLAVIVILVSIGWTAQAGAQTAISADGMVESTSGGFKFPDGTIQATAAGGAPVEDTGQTTCWGDDGVIRDCVGTGEDGEHQVGVTWPTPRFTANGDGTVTDNLTGLIWLQDANCPAGTRTWQLALDWIKNTLNAGGTACSGYAAGAFTNWRLPNLKELQSLIDYTQTNPALPAGHPFAGVSLDYYWSSTTAPAFPLYAWMATFEYGEVGYDIKETDSNHVWPVRGGQ